jgi:hypothetical protein
MSSRGGGGDAIGGAGGSIAFIVSSRDGGA